MVQVELSLGEFQTDRSDGGRDRTIAVLPLNLKFGLTDDVDLQLILTPYERAVQGSGRARRIADDVFPDVTTRVKINLIGNDGGGPAVAIMPFVTAPTAHNGPSAGHLEAGIIVPLALDLPSGFTLGTMAEFDWVYDPVRRDYGIDVVHSATVGHAIGPRVAGYLEYVGVAPRSSGGRYRILGSAGLGYAVTTDWALDCGGRVGLAGRAEDLVLFAGTSFRF